jgi:O-antigen/teichoic acid export membrane protein
LVVIAAQSTSPAQLGTLALVIALYRLTVAITRALVAEPLIALDEAGGSPAGALHAAALIGVVGGLVCLGAGMLAGPGAQTSFLIVAGCLPALCVQDVARYLSVGRGRAARAATLDAVWIGVQLVCSVAVAALTEITLELAIATWLIGGVVAALVALATFGVRPTGGRRWLATRAGTASQFLVEYGAIHGVVQGAYLLVATIVSTAAAGAMRSIETLFGPYSVVLLGTRPALVRSLRSTPRSPAAWTRGLRRIGMGLLAVVAATAAMVLVLPDSLGELLLGDTWSSARDLAPAYATYAAAVALSGVPMVGLRAIGEPRDLARARLLEAPLALGLLTGGAVLFEAAGALLGLALGSVVGTALAWRSLRRHLAGGSVSAPGRAPLEPS